MVPESKGKISHPYVQFIAGGRAYKTTKSVELLWAEV